MSNLVINSNGQVQNKTKLDESLFYAQKESSELYASLYDYIKSVTQELSEEKAFYVLDLADILWKVQLWYEKMPGIKPFYAVKANPDPVLVRLFVLLGFSFDCSTKGEIQLILKHGGSPKNIIFAHPIKPPSSLKYAAKVGVNLLTFDSEEELYKIKQHHPSAQLVLRIKVETPRRAYDLSEKFGCPMEDVTKMLEVAKSLELNVMGVSFHVGALCDDPQVYKRTIENCRTVCNISKNLGFQFTIVDLGAGFYGSNLREKYFDEVTSVIKESIKNNFPTNSVRIIAEPGTYFVGSAQRYVTCVLGKKSLANKQPSNDISNNGFDLKEVQKYYYVNEGYYGSFFKGFSLYDSTPQPLIKREELNKRNVLKSRIWGQTCCSEDVILEECMLPDLNQGEYIVWENMGSYTQGVSSCFTRVSHPVPKRVYIKNARLHLEWIENFEEVMKFIAENATYVESRNYQ